MASYRDASEQALVTTFSTSTTRHAVPSLAANVEYHAPPVFSTTDIAQPVWKSISESASRRWRERAIKL